MDKIRTIHREIEISLYFRNKFYHNMRTNLFILLFGALSLFSCNRYDEGSNFSLLTAKARAVGEWVVTSITVNGQDITNTFPSVKASIKDDNTYVLSFSVFGFKTYENGSWAFNDDKTRFIMTSEDGNVSDRRIIMLKNKMMKLEEINAGNGDVTIWQLEQ